jgi:hypothetical protein
VDPLIDTDTPKLSLAAPSEAVSWRALEAFTQPPGGSTKK